MDRTGGSPSAGPSPAYAAGHRGGGQQQQEPHHHHHHYPEYHHQHHHQHQHHQQFHVSVPTAAHGSSGPPYQRHGQESHHAERRVAASPAPSPQYPAHEHPPQHGGHTGHEDHRRLPTHNGSPYDERHQHQLQQPHHQHHAYGNNQPMHHAPHAPGYPPAPPEGRASSAASTPGYPAPHHHHHHQHQQQPQPPQPHHSHHASHSHGDGMAECTLPYAYGRPQEPHQHQERYQQREPSLQPQYQHQQHHHQQVREPSQLRASSVQSMASVAQIGHSRAPSLAPSAAAGVPSSYAALDRAGGPHTYPQAYQQHQQPPHQPQQRPPVQQGAPVPPGPRGAPRQPLLHAQGPPMTVSIGTRGNDRSTNREGLTASSKGFVLHAPGLFGSSWHKTPANPANGLGGIPVEDLSKDDFKFYCDPCQKGFNSKRLFDTHMEDHIYCEFPGCKFTCRKGKEWKMELHVTALHNRPDAPNLEDNEAYVRNRKSRFPTVETVQTKVEELYYKASRGEVLPDERRRWLKQHGVFVSRKWYLPVMREGDAALEESRRRRNEKRARQGADPEPASAAAGVAAGGSEEAQRRPPQPGAEASSAAGAAAGGDDLSRYARKPGERMLPLGPNGRYTKSQLVQMARERYENAQRAPAYYVCNRCGEKGHWVEACPKAKDATFDFEARWAGPKPTMKPATAGVATENAGGDDGEGDAASKQGGDGAQAVDPVGADTSAALPATADGSGGGAAAEVEDNEMTEVSAKAQDVDPALREQAEAIRRVNGPALEARLASAQQRSARRAATAALEEGAPESEALAAAIRRARMRRMPTGPPKATLWDRLTEDQRMNEHSVLLQAIRFFRLRNYFDTAAPAGAPEGGAALPAGDATTEAAAPDDNLEEV